MSRVGKMPIVVPANVKVDVQGQNFVVEGPKGKLSQPLFADIPVTIENGSINVGRTDDDGPTRARHGLVRALLRNAVVGVTEGFSRQLEIVGVGYKGEIRGREAHFALGYSHPVVFSIPEGIDIEIDKANKIAIKGANRHQVGQVAAEIRSLRPPDPYKAKGIRYSNEVIRRKEGKAGGKGGKK